MMGEKAQAGTLIFNVIDTKWHKQLGKESESRVPNNRFLVLHLSVVNGGAAEAIVPPLKLTDSSGQTHEELQDGTGVENWIGFFRKVNASGSLQGTVLFDAPPKAYRLQVSDDGIDPHIAYIDLPLRFEDETFEMPGVTPDRKRQAVQ